MFAEYERKPHPYFTYNASPHPMLHRSLIYALHGVLRVVHNLSCAVDCAKDFRVA